MKPLMQVFGIRPWEINLLTIEQFNHLCALCEKEG